jgi:hypothetical protein
MRGTLKFFVFFLCAAFLVSCASTQSSTTATSAASSGKDPKPEDLYNTNWILEQQSVDQVIGQEQTPLKVDYETYMVFTPGKVKKDVICHFSEPATKTLIVSTEAPAVYKDNTVQVMQRGFEKQEYKQTLVPVSGKGPKKLRSLYCTDEIKAAKYKFAIEDDHLILDPIEDSLRLKKYITK